MARKRETDPADIVSAAIHCFAQRGYHDTKTADIARCAGVSEGTLYNYFKGKQALFLSVIEHINSVIDDTFSFEYEDDDIIDGFCAEATSIAAFAKANSDYIEILVRDLRHREATKICADFIDRHHREKHGNVVPLARACGLDPSKDEEAALVVAFHGGLEQIITRWCVGDDKKTLERDIRQYVTGFISILKKAGRKGRS